MNEILKYSRGIVKKVSEQLEITFNGAKYKLNHGDLEALELADKFEQGIVEENKRKKELIKNIQKTQAMK